MSQKSPNLPVNIDIQAILDGITQLDNNTLQSFAEKINILVAQRKAAHLSKKETELIEKINVGVPEKIQTRYRELLKKSALESLSEIENKELRDLIPVIEAKNVERLELLIDLAQLWGKSVDEVMSQLGIKPAEYV